MSRISPVELDQTDSTTNETLTALKNKFGMLPNLFTVLAQSPAALNGYLQLGDIITSGKLSAKQRELIAITVAQENECEYCLSAHTAIGKSIGIDSTALDMARKGNASDSMDQAVMAFALNVVHSRGAVSNADLENARTVFKDDGIMIEIILNVSMNIMSNYVNRLAATDVDFPLVSLT